MGTLLKIAKFGLGLGLGATLLGLAPVQAAANPGAESAAPAYALPDTQVWDITSDAGVPYRIFVSHPQGQPPKEGYPVLYVLDANAMFAGFAEARRIHTGFDGGHDQVIVVGIGYPIDKPYADRRLTDFTGPFQSQELARIYKDYKAGGRQAFLDFITGPLADELDRRYSINAARRSLYGHSLGGLFALFTLYQQPQYFHSVIAASPSIWWDNQSILQDEARFASQLRENRNVPQRLSRLFIQVGELEETPVTVADNFALSRRLQELSEFGLRSQLEVFAGETHLTVPSRSVTPTLRAAMQWP